MPDWDMDVNDRCPNILHLAGITCKDFKPVEELFDEKVLEGVNDSDRAPVIDVPKYRAATSA